jgi:hypothetical protein
MESYDGRPAMRVRVLALTIAGVLAWAGAAAAQLSPGVAVNAPDPPQANYVGQSQGGPASEWSSRHQRYLMRLQSLREWLLRLKAKDGGNLSDEHAAILQRQLDKLNRIYGKG